MACLLTADQESALSQEHERVDKLKQVKAQMRSSPLLSHAQSVLQAVKKESEDTRMRSVSFGQKTCEHFCHAE